MDVPRRVLDALERHKEHRPPIDGDYVFRTEEGTSNDPDNWYKRDFPAIRKRAKLRSIGLHALRHTYASLLINQGEGIKYVSRQLGHASISTTLDNRDVGGPHKERAPSSSSVGRHRTTAVSIGKRPDA